MASGRGGARFSKAERASPTVGACAFAARRSSRALFFLCLSFPLFTHKLTTQASKASFTSAHDRTSLYPQIDDHRARGTKRPQPSIKRPLSRRPQTGAGAPPSPEHRTAPVLPTHRSAGEEKEEEEEELWGLERENTNACEPTAQARSHSGKGAGTMAQAGPLAKYKLVRFRMREREREEGGELLLSSL